MPAISYIVARSEPRHVIGCENRLPWHLRTDLQNFKRITSHHVVIMGRKTFESIGKPLPNRINIVMSGKAQDESENLFFASSQASALYFADLFSILRGKEDVFVIGGGSVYEGFGRIFNKVYLTEVYADVNGDAYFKYDFSSDDWQLSSEKRFEKSDCDEFPFALKVFTKRNLSASKRSRFLSSFLKPDETLNAWEAAQLEKVGLKQPERLLAAIQPKLPNLEKVAV